MVNTGEFIAKLSELGYNFYAGVPCSIFKTLISQLESGENYIPVTREDEGLGMCSGAQLAGKTPVMIMQNSGLGNSINVLSSLLLLYKIPTLMLISWRGETKEEGDISWQRGFRERWIVAWMKWGEVARISLPPLLWRTAE